MRFIFLKPTNGLPQDPPSSEQGLEIMRLHPKGNVGIGSDFTNAFPPHRRLVVRQNTGVPQFRIAYEGHGAVTLGQHADFQVPYTGNLHIKAMNNIENRTVAIGFLQGEASDPINNTQVQTALDVGGITRIRKIPNDHAPDCLVAGYKVGSNIKDNFLIRIDFPQDPDLVLNGVGGWISASGGGNDFDWETDGTNVWTGHGLNGYPDGDVSIGSTPVYLARLSVIENATAGGRFGQLIRMTTDAGPGEDNSALRVEIGANSNERVFGVDALAESTNMAMGGRFQAYLQGGQSENCAGVAGYGYGFSNDEVNRAIIGVYGQGNSIMEDSHPIGIYGESFINQTVQGISGLFLGNVQTTNTPITLSDESTKTDIAPLDNATAILMELHPKTYKYDWQESLGLTSGDTSTVCGFLAQDVQEVFPAAVSPYYQPARYDTAGTLLHESVDLLGLKYDEFIPLLVAGFKEQHSILTAQEAAINEQNGVIEGQNATIDALQDQLADQAQQIAELQEDMAQVMTSFQQTKSQVNNCCGTGGLYEPQTQDSATKEGVTLQQNVPNPFSDETLISFELEKPATVRLDISDSAGRVLETVVEERMEPGTHQARWDGSRYASGVYYYSLYADTVLLTKKMIKK